MLFGCQFAPTTGAEPFDAREKRLYTVANSHLDTQWNWTIQSTIYPYLSNTLHGNFAHITNFPNYVFNFEGAFRYRLAKEYYPEAYQTLKHHIAAGRWRVAGSVVDAGDVIVPSPESLFRQILYGNRLYQQEFGKTSTDIFLPDCFGFPASLPSIAAHAGLTGFSTAKLRWGSAVPFPFQNIGRWIGPDGASVVAIIEPGAYDSAITENLATSTNYLARIERMNAASGLNVDFRYFGTGDIGGAPSRAYVEWLERSIALGGPIKVLSAGADDLFRDLTPEQVSWLPTYQGELLMRVHGVGCYTSHSEMKTYNRRNERWADAAERAAVIADWLQGGGTYPKERLTKAWERFLWHQFHDDLTGTSIDEAYTFSWNDELLSLKEFAAEQTRGVGVLAKALDTTVPGVPLVVFNPLARERTDVVEAEVRFGQAPPAAVRVFGPDGAEVPAQSSPGRSNTLLVNFLARVPSVGAAVFDVRPAPTAAGPGPELSVAPSHLENARYRVQLVANGDVSSIFDKRHRRELLRAPIRWAFRYNLSTTWPAWEITYAATTGTPTFLGAPVKVEILERGPTRVTLGVTRFKDGSAFVERISLAAGEAGDRVDWDVSVNWHTLKTLLKVELPLAVANPKATFDLGLGTIERGNAAPNLYEVPAQQWADLTDAAGAYGVSILNDSKYGWDKPNDHTLRLTVFHTPEADSAYPHGAFNSVGTHRLRFAVFGHANDWRAGQSPWAAARVNQPLQAFQTAAHPGALGRTFSLLACDNPNVMVKAIKQAENGNEVVVRLHELTGQPQSAELSAVTAITAARELNASETALRSLAPVNGKLPVSFTPYQPKTLAFTLATASNPIPKTESVPVVLPFDLDVFTSDANRADGDFENGLTYPAELLPAELKLGGVTFRPGSVADGALSALTCRGQTIPVNASNFTQLYFLAAAAGADTAGRFLVDGRPSDVTVQHFTGFIGQWKPPQLKPAEVAHVFTHRHTREGNDPYRFGYFFLHRLDLPPTTKNLTLPDAPNIRLFAMSLARGGTEETFASGGPLADNELPWADVGADLLVSADVDGLARLTLDASACGDADGKLISYVWSRDNQPFATGARPTVELSVGSHHILLTVADDRNAISQDLLTVTVRPPLAVTLNASPNPAASAPATIQFTAEATGGLNREVDLTDDSAGVASAQGEYPPSERAGRAFDNSASSKWLDFAAAQPAARASWLQYRFANDRRATVTTYTLTSAGDAPARDPRDWRLLGSNDGANWTTLDTRTNETFAARHERREFRPANPAAFSVYRLQIDSVANPPAANSVQLAELELIGSPEYTFAWNFGDGTTSSTQNPRHTFLQPGSYPVTVAVTHGRQTGTNRMIIAVGPPLTVTPSATATTNAAGHLSVRFTAQASDGNLQRVPGVITTDGLGIVTAQGENPPAESRWHALDGLAATKWLDFTKAYPGRQSSWLQYRQPGRLQRVTNYALTSANDAPERDPKDWRLLGSNDGTNWTTLDTQREQFFAHRFERREYGIARPGAYEFHRLQIDGVVDPPAAQCLQLGELELIGTPVFTYHWAFGDGATSLEQNPTHTYQRPGSFEVTLIVSDGVARATNRFAIPSGGSR